MKKMYYKLVFDMDEYSKSSKRGTNAIFAENTNTGEIVYEGIKKGFFHTIILSPNTIKDWPNVEFYYNSKESTLESDYLLNVIDWPIVHIRVMKEFNRKKINGIQYFPIKLIDKITKEVNTNYVLMYVENFIDGFDMQKSEYHYNEKYDFYTFIPAKTFLNQNVCSKYDIFRCTKSKAEIYVSEKIADIVETNGWTGFAFYEQP